MSQTAIATSTYNGWGNRETWLGNLWLTNDEGFYRLLEEAIQKYESLEEVAIFIEAAMCDQLYCEIDSASLWQDLIGTAFNRIDWLEIVTNNEEMRSES